MPHRRRETGQNFVMDEDSPWPFSTKMTLGIIGGILLAGASWYNVKADIKSQADVSAQHSEQLAGIHADLKQINEKLDRLTIQRGGGFDYRNPRSVANQP